MPLVKTAPSQPVPHPIPYQGSKRALAPAILAWFPRVGSFSRLVEPFAGSAAITLAAAHCRAAEHFWINDAHASIAGVWREIVARPEQLAAGYERLWLAQHGRARQFFDEVRTQFNAAPQAEKFLFLLARCVKAAVRFNRSGEFNNSPDNRRLGARPATMRRKIALASALLVNRCEVTGLDYSEMLEQCGPSDLIYLDPPYQGVSSGQDRRYGPSVDHDEFCEHLAALNERQCMYLVSYDGRTGGKRFGKEMPKSLGLKRIELPAGRSAQATLLGRDEQTYESLYLSPALVAAK